MSESPASYRFRPRYRSLAWLAMATGSVLIGYALFTGESRALALIMGAMGIALGLIYQASPVWKLRIVPFAAGTGDAQEGEDHGEGGGGGLRVLAGDVERFALRFDEIEALIVVSEHKTCFVHTGTSGRSILLPGPGANASYDIEGKEALYDLLVANVPEDRVREVENLGKWLRQKRRQGGSALEPEDPSDGTSTETSTDTRDGAIDQEPAA